MRELFRQNYQPNESDFDELLQNCIVAVDANVLLDFYRVQKETREELFSIFEGFQERFWVPYQAGMEFQRNRLKVRDEQRTQAAKVQEGLRDAHSQLATLLQAHQRHAFLNTPSIMERVTDLIEGLISDIQKQVEAYPIVTADDPLHERITDLVGEKIGQPYTLEKRNDLTKDAKSRFAAKVPPGYKDSHKEGDEAYGDFFVWRELLDKARESQQPVVFVTRDVKEDWVQRVGGKTIGPRPELIAEMFAEAGVRFHLYETARFMDYAGKFLEQQVSPESIEEVRNLPTEEVSDELEYATEEPQQSAAVSRSVSDSSRLGVALALGQLRASTLPKIHDPLGEALTNFQQSLALGAAVAQQQELQKLWASINVRNPILDTLADIQKGRNQAVLDAIAGASKVGIVTRQRTQRKTEATVSDTGLSTPAEASSESDVEAL